MNPLGVALAIGTVGLLWWLTQNKPKFFVPGGAQGALAYWPKLAVGPAKQKLDQLVATPTTTERVWLLSPRTDSSPTALTTVLQIQGRGNLAVVQKNLLEVGTEGGPASTMMSEVTPAEAAALVPASQDDIGVLA